MKKRLLFVFISLFFSQSNAQDPQLFEYDWYLHKVTIDGLYVFPPDIIGESETGYIYFYEEEDFVSIGYCDYTTPMINYDLIENIFSLENDPYVLPGFCGHPDNLSFAQDYFSIFYNQAIANNPFSYTISFDGSGNTTLTIENPEGNQAIYGDEILSAIGFDKTSISIYPNPAQEILNIRAKEIISSISISNVLGQVIYNSNIDALGMTLNLSAYSKGTYFVKVTVGKETFTKKFIKE